MMTETNTEYAYRTLLDLPYEQVIEKVTSALKEEGFGVMTEIDVQATLKQKLDVDFRKYMILGACNPSLAHKAFGTELEVGLLLPCNVIVYEDEGNIVVSILDPIKMLNVANNSDLDSVAEEARASLQRVIKSLQI